MILTILIIIVLVIIYFFRYYKTSINDNIKDIKWYRYDNTTGYYETFYVDNNTFYYNIPSKSEEYSSCKSYTFDKKNNSLVLNCKKTIEIVSSNNNSLVLNVDKEEKYFYKNIEDSLNYEFRSYYNKSISEYKKDNNQVLDFIKINENKLESILNEEENYRIIFFGDKCTSVECALILGIIDKWVVKKENVYYINSNELSEQTINNLNNRFNLIDNRDLYNDVYPLIINSEKNNINQYKFKCEGFNCEKYKN